MYIVYIYLYCIIYISCVIYKSVILIKCISSPLSSTSSSPNLYISNKILMAVLTNLNFYITINVILMPISVIFFPPALHFSINLLCRAFCSCIYFLSRVVQTLEYIPGLLIRSLAQNPCLPSTEINLPWIPMGTAGLAVCVGRKHTQLEVFMSAMITSQTVLQWRTDFRWWSEKRHIIYCFLFVCSFASFLLLSSHCCCDSKRPRPKLTRTSCADCLPIRSHMEL